MSFNRRDILRAGLGAASAAIADRVFVSQVEAAEAPLGYTLPKLPYAFNALEPHVDAKTMEIHHDKHHAAYVDKLNEALAKHPELKKKDPVTLIREIAEVPEDIRQAVVNNGGGHVNHSLFWQMMKPKGGGNPTGEVAKAIDASFGSFKDFQTQFADAAMKRFGSGWAWLVVGDNGKLEIVSTANQDSPLMTGEGKMPILGLDVWEHAYYLKHQNKRADYVTSWWNVVNWDFVNDQLSKAKS